MLPKTCPNAGTFDEIMQAIWDGNLSYLYPTWHNANLVASHFGLRKYRNGFRGIGEGRTPGYLYSFPDKSRVFVYKDGSGVEAASPAGKARKRSGG